MQTHPRSEHIEALDEAQRRDFAVDRLTESIENDERIRHVSADLLPDRTTIVQGLDRLIGLMFPGFFGRQEFSAGSIRATVQAICDAVRGPLAAQIARALTYRPDSAAPPTEHHGPSQADLRRAEHIVAAFLEELPDIRSLLSLDVQAAYDGDPAAAHTDEAVACYPGVRALAVHRLAHALYRMDVPLVPRIMSEHAHSITGIDIHPGARIGGSFFIDHGTGVVIGETSVIGEHCKLYQGVTLGAKSFPKDERGNFDTTRQRHPTLEDYVTVYAGATILGGDTVIGAGSVVNGGVFLTHSVPPGHVVRAPRVELTLRSNPVLPPTMHSI